MTRYKKETGQPWNWHRNTERNIALNRSWMRFNWACNHRATYLIPGMYVRQCGIKALKNQWRMDMLESYVAWCNAGNSPRLPR